MVTGSLIHTYSAISGLISYASSSFTQPFEPSDFKGLVTTQWSWLCGVLFLGLMVQGLQGLGFCKHGWIKKRHMCKVMKDLDPAVQNLSGRRPAAPCESCWPQNPKPHNPKPQTQNPGPLTKPRGRKQISGFSP